ncbi:MAG: hypothetical protein E7161_04465 [Firmicutes bacterium]|nr:hypothetical protein [Bacillota bacterium]
MNYHVIELDGEEIKLRLRSADSVEIEKKTGVKLLDYIQDYSLTTVTTLLKYMRKSVVPNFSDKDAYELYDRLVDNGYTLEDIVFKVIYETAVVSGFLKKSDLEEMLQFKEESQATLKEKKKQEVLQS